MYTIQAQLGSVSYISTMSRMHWRISWPAPWWWVLTRTWYTVSCSRLIATLSLLRRKLYKKRSIWQNAPPSFDHMGITLLSRLSHVCHMTITCLSHDLTWGSRQMRIDWRPVGIFEACFRPPASWTHHCTCHSVSPGPGWNLLSTACSPTVKQTDALARLRVDTHMQQ